MTGADFWEQVDDSAGPDACWPWAAYRNPKGYGRIRLGGRIELAHRVAYEISHGEVPESLCVCHSCDNPACCNPAHLWVGTQADNLRDMWEKGRGRPGRSGNGWRTHCVNGHEYTPENTLRGSRGRQCRACRQQRNREYYEARRRIAA